jgi:hypothetical protein
MASDITPSVEQRCIIILLVKETAKQAEIFRKLNAENREETLSYASAYDWYNKFSEGCNVVTGIPHAHIQPTAVCT